LPITLLAASIDVWLFYIQHHFEDTFWAHDVAGIFMMPGCTAVRTMALRASCAGLRPISASTTFIIHAAGSLITGCTRCYGITVSSLLLDGLLHSMCAQGPMG
jgi:hypothetical protein